MSPPGFLGNFGPVPLTLMYMAPTIALHLMDID